MTKINWLNITDKIVKILVYIMIGYFFFQIGETVGRGKERELQKEVECVVEYDDKPYAEVPVKCLKYFDINTRK